MFPSRCSSSGCRFTVSIISTEYEQPVLKCSVDFRSAGGDRSIKEMSIMLR